MNLKHLGEQIDIHGGGNDLIFPHHENEIAQTESLTGKPFAHYWLHNGMLQLSGEKMSKSLGNLITIDEFLAKHEGDVLRMLVLNSSYRSPLTFNEEVIAQAERALDRLRSALRPARPETDHTPVELEHALEQQMEATRQGFLEAMDDDFNTAGALGQLLDLLRELSGVLGLRLERQEMPASPAEPFIDLLLEVRGELRRQKLWDISDMVRDRLAEMGVALEDSKEGTTWHWK
jgi:cysteinyl-tRNA synthetase